MAGRRPRGALEGEVLSTLQAADRALTVAEVVQRVGGGLAYTTVMTILARLHEKGTVQREPAGRAYAYRPVADEAGLTARRMRRLLDAGPDRDTVLARFVDDLSDDDERALRRLLEGADETPGEGS